LNRKKPLVFFGFKDSDEMQMLQHQSSFSFWFSRPSFYSRYQETE